MVEQVQVAATRSIISAAAAARVAKKYGGAGKIGKDASLALAKEAEKFLTALTKKAVLAAGHAGRRVVRTEDVVFATTN